MAYVTEIDIFIYDPPHHSGYVGGDPMPGGYYVHEEYDHLAHVHENHAW